MRASRSLVVLVVLTVVVAAPVSGVEPGTYDLRSEGTGWRAPCPGQGFDALIGPTEVRVSPGDGAWQLALAFESIGREGAMVEVAPAGVAADGPRAELHRGAVVEWYVNSPRGLEQGFSVAERPDGEGPLALELALGGSLLARTAQDGRGIDLHAAGSSLAALSYRGLAVEDANGRQLEAHLELRGGGGGDGTRLRIVVDDSDAAYPLTVDPLIATAAWSSAEVLSTHAAAWGDMNGDGALELALGSWAGQNHVYMSTADILDQICWSSPDTRKTVSLAWGDWDGDGDLDLAAGDEDQGVQVFANVGGTLTSPPAWTSSETDKPFGLAWGDWDGDGDLDLAVGNAGQPNRARLVLARH